MSVVIECQRCGTRRTCEDWGEPSRCLRCHPAPVDEPTMSPTPEPTTQEALQAARDGIGCIGDDPVGVNTRARAADALALLERRMQEMERRMGDV